jgi:Uma2 family endonuclease
MNQVYETTRAESLGDLLRRLGNVSPKRIRMNPPPGEATVRDVIRIHDRENRLYELIDGTLVEKVMGLPHAKLAFHLGHLIQNYLDDHPGLGEVSGADSTLRIFPKMVRIPDVVFISYERLPANSPAQQELAPKLAPDLAVEILSPGNTRGEMRRKLRDYFRSGVRLVWYVDAKKRAIQVFTAADQSTTLTEADALDGGDVIPGLRLPVKKVFAKLPPAPPKKRRPSR